jgi:hypothetical protein
MMTSTILLSRKDGEKQQFVGGMRAYIPNKNQGGEKQRWIEGKTWSNGHGYGQIDAAMSN